MCLIGGLSHVEFSKLENGGVLQNACSSCSLFTLSGSPSSFQIRLNCVNISPLWISSGPNSMVSFFAHGGFSCLLHHSLMILTLAKSVSKSTRSFSRRRSASKSRQGSLPPFFSMPPTRSSRHANFARLCRE